MILLILFLVICQSKNVTFSNVSPRLDTQGNIIDAHDGSIQKFSSDGPYYYHAVEYGLCVEPAQYGCDQTADHCGFQQTHNVSVWSSPDLSSGSWKFVSYALNVADRPQGVLFRPHVVYNPNTKKYVLWFNIVADFYVYVAATSDNVAGPFVVQNTRVNVTRGQEGGDFDFLVDKDGTGYVVYSNNYVINVEQLTPDFLYSTGKSSQIFTEYFVEAPTFFQRNGLYYILFGWCCCFCYQGSGLLVHTAPAPLGPWTTLPGDLACVSSTFQSNSSVGGAPTPGQGCQYHDPTTTSITRAQQNYVIQVDTSTGGKEYIYTGDRWQQSPDGFKGHDPQYWYPLKFNSDGSIQPVTWVDSFVVDVA